MNQQNLSRSLGLLSIVALVIACVCVAHEKRGQSDYLGITSIVVCLILPILSAMLGSKRWLFLLIVNPVVILFVLFQYFTLWI